MPSFSAYYAKVMDTMELCATLTMGSTKLVIIVTWNDLSNANESRLHVDGEASF